jgi:hypothetical protein
MSTSIASMAVSYLVSYAIGIVGVVGLALAWVGVQRAWARQFPDDSGDPDVLARRRGCDGCGCATPCRPRDPRRTLRD